MPGLSPKEYDELRQILSAPDSGLNADEMERAHAAVAAFDEQYESGMRGGLSTEDALAMGPPSPAGDVSRETTGSPDLTTKLDPRFPLLPQADATAPATTHPGGDQQAAMEWMGGKPGGDITFVYEPPVEVARQKLLENPQLARTLFENIPNAMSPEVIAGMQKGDDAYERVANRMWADTAKAAAEAGKTVYRYSKTPWLHDGQMMNTIQKLGGFASVAPAAFIMGVDQGGFFGAGRAVNEAVAGDEANQAQSVADTNAPGVALAGQALGVLAPWSATNKLWNFIGSGGKGIAGKLGGGLAARALAAGGAASVAAGADQALREGAGALGDGGFDLGQSGARVGAAMNPLANPLAPALGVGGELLGSAAKAGADWTRHRAYGGAIGEMEGAGSKFRFGRAPTVSDDAEEMVRQGRAEGVAAQGPRAAELVPQVMAGAKKIKQDAIEQIAERNRPFYESREGQMRLPARGVAQAAVDNLRAQYQTSGGGLRRMPGSAEDINEYRIILREQTDGVSVEPMEDAIELSGEEAQQFLTAGQKKTLSQGEYAGGPVYLIPRRYNAEEHERMIKKYSPNIDEKNRATENTYRDRAYKTIRQAAYRDRDARPMDGVEGGWSDSQRKAYEELKQAENIQKRVGLTEDAALQTIAGHSRQGGPGEIFDVRALRAAADKGGVREQLDNMRALDPWQRLQRAMSPGAASGEGGSLGFAGAATRMGHVGLAYPIAKGLESPLGPIRGGTAGRFSLLRGNKLATEEEERK